MNTIQASAILGESVSAILNGQPQLASGQPLTAAQKRRIQWLLDNGLPEVITAEVVDAEATSRIAALIRPEDQVFLIASAMPAIVAELAAIRAGDAEPASYITAKANLALFGQAAAIRAAAEAIKAGTLPADYEALVDAFDTALA